MKYQNFTAARKGGEGLIAPDKAIETELAVRRLLGRFNLSSSLARTIAVLAGFPVGGRA